MSQLADLIRVVPETAVRIFLGAQVTPGDGEAEVALDGRVTRVTEEVLNRARAVVRGLQVRAREIQYASDVLELRHDAEDIFLTQMAEYDNVPKILFVPAGEMASAYYRAKLPADIMMDNGSCLANWTERLDLGKASRYDILWIQLVAAPLLIKIAEEAKAGGIKIVYDVDDKFDEILPENPAAAIYADRKKADVWRLIELSDVCTVSTQDLARHIGTRARDVRVLPNHLPAAIWPVRKPRHDGIFRILWAGSPTHRRDLAIVAPALQRVLRDAAGKVRFCCFGEEFPEALEDARQYCDALKFVSFQEYGDALADVGADLAIAPLENNSFNRSKSAIKALEYGASGYPALLSPVGEYPEVVSLGLPAELVQDDSWEFALRSAIAAPPGALAARGEAARRWVLENRCLVKTGAARWSEVAQSLMGARVQ